MSVALVRHRYWLLAVAALLAILAAPAARNATMDRSLDALLAPNDPDAIAAAKMRSILGDHPIVMLVYADDGLETVAGLQRNAALTDAVSATAGVRGVLSPAVLESLVARMRPLGRRPALFQPRDQVASGFDEMFAGYTHAADHSHAAVVAILNRSQTTAAVDSIRASISGWQTMLGRPIALVGEPVLVDDAFDLIERDGRTMAAIVLVLLTAVIVLSLWDFRPAATAVLTIALAVTLTRALMAWFELPISLVSSILSAIVTIIAVTSTLHLGVAVQTARRTGTSGGDAVAIAIDQTARPIFWTCATTAAGFLALLVSRIVPVQQFGIMVAIGTAAVPLSLLLIAPAVFSIRRFGSSAENLALDQDSIEISRPPPHWLSRLAVRMASGAIPHRRLLMVIAVVLTAIGIWGTTRARVESNFLRNFRDTSEIAIAYRDVEDQLGGAGIWDVLVPIPDELDRDTMDAIRDLQDQLRAIRVSGDAKLTKVLSLADADEVAKHAPLMRFVAPESRLGAMHAAIPVFYDTLITPPAAELSHLNLRDPRRYLRIMLRANENLTSQQKIELIAAVRRTTDAFPSLLANESPTDSDGSFTTGYYVILTRLVASLLADQWRCLGASMLFITILLALALKKLRRVVAAMAINLMPILWILGIAGWMTSTLNMGAAMIAAVSIGLSIDGSVHYLLSLPKTTPTAEQASAAAAKTGLPILLATAALILGFGTLTTSEFVPTATFGMLLSATLAVAAIANLTLLPAAVARTG